MRFRNLDKLTASRRGYTKTLSIPLPTTPDGRVYRFSPNPDAHPRHFVLGNSKEPVVSTPEMRARMKLQPGSPQTVCPYSGVVADDQEFTHPDDLKAAMKIAEAAAINDVRAEVERMAGAFNRTLQGNGPLSISMSVSGRKPTRPRFYRRDLLRELLCDHCGRDYGVFAIGLFCPDCGAPNLSLHFSREIELVSSQVALAEDLGEGSEELAYRLLGNAHEDVLTAFEASLKTVFYYAKRQEQPSSPLPNVRNDFQNIDRARARFSDLHIDPFATLSGEDLAALALNIQKRHVIGHNLGVVDPKFAQHSAESEVGETVALVGTDIRAFGAICSKAIAVLDSWLAGEQAQALPAIATPGKGSESVPLNSIQKAAAELRVSVLAARVAQYLVHASSDGRKGHVESDGLCDALSDVDHRSLGEAIAELDLDGYLTTLSVTNRRLPHLSLTVEFFASFDPYFSGFDPSEDAIQLAERALANDDSVSVVELHTDIGWPIRRFNPALQVLIEQIDDRRLSKTVDLTYPTRHFYLGAEDRVALRRFIAETEA